MGRFFLAISALLALLPSLKAQTADCVDRLNREVQVNTSIQVTLLSHLQISGKFSHIDAVSELLFLQLTDSASATGYDLSAIDRITYQKKHRSVGSTFVGSAFAGAVAGAVFSAWVLPHSREHNTKQNATIGAVVGAVGGAVLANVLWGSKTVVLDCAAGD